MPGHENLSPSGIWRNNNPTEYTPAFPYGHIRDVKRIAQSSGRSIEEVQAMIESRLTGNIPDHLPQDWEVGEEHKEG